jgi:hypothetical protein
MPGTWSFAGYYYHRNQRLSGPVGSQQIKRLVALGKLKLSERVWERWRRGRKSLLFPALASTGCGRAVARKGQAAGGV